MLSLVLARWIKYIVYRDIGKTLAESQRLLGLAFFVVLAVCLMPNDPVGVLSSQALAAVVRLAAYAHQRSSQIGRSIRLRRA